MKKISKILFLTLITFLLVTFTGCLADDEIPAGKMFSIRFDTDGGSIVETITGEYNSPVIAPEDPTKEGHTFMGWNKAIPTKMPAKNVVISALWKVNQYKLTFDSNGGSEVKSMTLDYGKKIGKIEPPVKEGYIFMGWDKELPIYMPDEDIHFVAKWEIRKEIVTFNTNGGNEIPYQNLEYGSKVTKPADPEKVGYTFTGWTLDGAPFDFDSYIVKGDATIDANWQINEYTISFDTDGGSVIDDIKQDYNTEVTAPANPTKVGYTFVGWDKEIPAFMPAENVEIKALWKINQYTVSFDVDGVVTKVTGDYNTAVTPVADPEKVGYTFDGWDKAVPSVFPAENVTVKATWKINQYTISFDVDGGSAIDNIKQDYNTNITAPADPTKVGYAFVGWDKEIPAYMPAENVEIKALWKINQYTISFDVDGVVTKVTGDYNTAVTPVADPEKVGYTFDGWDKAVPSVFGAEDVTVKATWKINQYTVSFDVDGVVTKVTGDYNTAVTPVADPEKVGYTFTGWDKAVPSLFPAEDVTVKATWKINQYTVSFDVDGVVTKVTGDYNTVVTPIADPEKVGYTFTGWDKAVPSVFPAEDVTIKATWKINQYTVSFDVDGVVTKVTGDYNTVVAKVADPEKVGYTFTGWDKDVPSVFPAEDVTVKATWKINQYKLTFNFENGTLFVPNYNTYEEVVADFKADLKSFGISSFTNWSFSTKFYRVFSETNGKWDWLLRYFIEVSDANYSSVKADNVFQALLDRNESTDYSIFNKDNGEGGYGYFFSTEIYGFTTSSQQSVYSGSLKSADYSLESVRNKISKYIPGEIYNDSYELVADYGTKVPSPLVPEKAGYSFTGWDEVVPSTIPAGNMVFNSSYTIREYTITFNTDGGSTIESITQNYNTAIVAPENPTKAGYRFIGWDVEIPETMPAKDMTIIAIWELITYDVTYKFEGGSLLVNKYDSLDDIIADFLNDYNTARGKSHTVDSFYALGSWGEISDASLFLYNSEYRAKWAWLVDYIASVASSANKSAWNSFNNYNSQAELNAESTNHIYRIAYELRGFVAQKQYDKNSNFVTADYSNPTVSNKYKEYQPKDTYNDSYTITYLENEASKTVSNPTKSGYEFTGWDKEVPANINADLVVNALFEPGKSYITYNLNGGTIPTKYANVNDIITDFLNDYNENRGTTHTVETFFELGSGKEIGAASLFLYSATYRAKWAWLVDYIASVASSANRPAWQAFNNYNSQAELNAVNGNYIYEIAYELRAFVAQSQYTKNQWYHTADYSTQEVSNKVWNYVSRSEFKVDTPTFGLVTPVKLGYTFTGWYVGENKVNSIEVGTIGDVALEARWEIVNYTIKYENLDGATYPTLVSTYNINSSKITLPSGSEMTMSGAVFGGWFKEATLENQVYYIESGSYGNITLYAYWIFDTATLYEISEYDANVISATNPTLLVIPGLGSGRYELKYDGTSYGKYTLGTDVFKTIEAALLVAQEYDIIYVSTGTYSGELTVTTANIKIYGPNYGVKGTASRNGEASITGNINANANNLVLDGIKLSGTSVIYIGAIDGLTMKNIYSDSTGMGASIAENGNRKSIVYALSNCKNISMIDSYFNIGSAVYCKDVITIYKIVTNLTITGNYMTNDYAGAEVTEAIQATNPAGTVVISNNEFRYPTSNFVIMIGNYSNSANVTVSDNIFAGKGSYTTAGIYIRYGASGKIVNIEHNYIYSMAGNCLDFNSSKSGSIYNVRYNYFDPNTAFKITNSGSATINYVNNYYAGGMSSQTTVTPSDNGVITSLEALEAAYATFKENE